MRKIIAALQVSLDGFIEGPHALTLLEARPLKAGAVWLNYRVSRRPRGTAAEG